MPPKKKGKGKAKGKAKGKGKVKGKGKAKGKGKKKAGEEGATEKAVPDPFSLAARLNAYYIAHGPVQFLAFRGYSWGGGAGGKKKGGKKKKK